MPKKIKGETFGLIFKFGAVGIAATLSHALAFILILRLLGWTEQASNLAAFIIAFLLSWSGHYFWTFQKNGAQTIGQTMPRFFVVALSGYALNALFVFVVITKLAQPDFYVLPLMIFITPLMTFLLSRYWAFR